MADRLEWIRAQPISWLDWEPLNGGLEGHALVAGRYPQAQAYVQEATVGRRKAAQQALTKAWWNPQRWRAATLRFESPPETGVDLLWANMGLHMAADPQGLIADWHKQLAVGGFLMFSCLGTDTLRELRALYVKKGWPVPAHEFTDMHDWGDMLVHAGFAEPIMDMERITLTYATPQRLLTDLRELGRNLHPSRFAGLRTPRWKAALEDGLKADLTQTGSRDGDSKHALALSFEVVYGHAFKPAPKLRLDAHSAVSLEDMRTMLRSGRKPG